MPSVREQIIAAFFSELKTLESSRIKVLRNPDKLMKVPADGAIIILRDGESGDHPGFMHIISEDIEAIKEAIVEGFESLKAPK